ncbi:unnamed protein product [Lactuca saligna]|uniref:Uncharacterized protein n=1 Tax=Lactuca saligna TaxID=75948 RepID=A0AA35YYD8_LACSI|nr:unnamed protein product [Lactuca saligna]
MGVARKRRRGGAPPDGCCWEALDGVRDGIEVLKKKLIERKKEILDMKEKTKENGVKKNVTEESSSSRKPSFHPDEHQCSSYNDNSYVDKLHAEKPQAAHTRKASSHAEKSNHADKFVQANKTFGTVKLII